MDSFKCIKEYEVGDYTLKVGQVWYGYIGDDSAYLEHEEKRIFIDLEEFNKIFIKI